MSAVCGLQKVNFTLTKSHREFVKKKKFTGQRKSRSNYDSIIYIFTLIILTINCKNSMLTVYVSAGNALQRVNVTRTLTESPQKC